METIIFFIFQCNCGATPSSSSYLGCSPECSFLFYACAINGTILYGRDGRYICRIEITSRDVQENRTDLVTSI